MPHVSSRFAPSGALPLVPRGGNDDKPWGASDNHTTGIVVGSVVGVIFFGLLIVLVYLHMRRRRMDKAEWPTHGNQELDDYGLDVSDLPSKPKSAWKPSSDLHGGGYRSDPPPPAATTQPQMRSTPTHHSPLSKSETVTGSDKKHMTKASVDSIGKTSPVPTKPADML